jgi:hypothetical protein
MLFRGRDTCAQDIWLNRTLRNLMNRIINCALSCLILSAISSWGTEKNPPGDIPDDQIFVPYTSSVGGYSLKIPEGWARSEKGTDVNFTDKLDGIAVIVDAVAATPTATDVIGRLSKAERGFKIGGTKQITLPAGQALQIKYESESEPGQVTNKRIHLEDEAYVFHKNGKMAILILWAPAGADNADQWKLISESFRW